MKLFNAIYMRVVPITMFLIVGMIFKDLNAGEFMSEMKPYLLIIAILAAIQFSIGFAMKVVNKMSYVILEKDYEKEKEETRKNVKSISFAISLHSLVTIVSAILFLTNNLTISTYGFVLVVVESIMLAIVIPMLAVQILFLSRLKQTKDIQEKL